MGKFEIENLLNVATSRKFFVEMHKRPQFIY